MSSLGPRWVLSGGIGSGKSAVRRLLGAAGWSTIDADSIGHSVLEPEGAAFTEVADTWPEVVKDGRIERGTLAGIVFADAQELERLERITHPHIFGTILEHVEQLSGSVVVEIPLLHHHLGDDWKRMIIDCGDKTRLSRLVDRGMGLADAEARMAAQPSRGEWLAIADLVIPNHGTLEELERSVRLLG